MMVMMPQGQQQAVMVRGADGGGPAAAAGRCSRRAQRGPLILETVSGKITQLL